MDRVQFAKAEVVPEAVPDFTSLVLTHQSMVYSLALHFLRDRAIAEEVAQDVFLQLHRSMGELESASHAVHWLRRVTAHRCIDTSRRRGRQLEIPMEGAPEPASLDRTRDPMLSERLRRLVASLPEKARMLVVLRYQEDLDPDDIARVLEMPLNSVKSQLHRALTLLRQKAGAMDLES